MSIDKQALREAAQEAMGSHDRLSVMAADDIFDISQHEGTQLDADIAAVNVFNEAANPATVLALLNELEAAEKRIAQLEELCAEAYQVVGSLAECAGMWGTRAVEKALDNLSQLKKVHDDVLPFQVPVRKTDDCEHLFSAITRADLLECVKCGKPESVWIAEQRISSTWRKAAESNFGNLEAAEKLISELQTSLVVSDFKEAHKYQHRIAELEEKQRLIDICQGQGLEHRIAAEKRIAELEALTAEQDQRLIAYAAIAKKNATAASEARTLTVNIKRPTMGRAYSALARVWTEQEVREACDAAGIQLKVEE